MLRVPRPSRALAVPIVVYGTLRIGQGNYEWAKAAVLEEIPNVRIPGRIYFVFRKSGYPVAKLDEEGTILGDLLYFDHKHSDYIATYRMERGAGYVLQPVKAEAPGGLLEAYAWHYEGKPQGSLIKDGDWVKAHSA